MPIGIQEIIALVVVTLIVGFALYRRWRRKRAGAAGRAGKQENKTGEAPIRFYRRRN